MNINKAVLLINLGTPEKPKKKEVRRYLFEFLNDKRVIDLPWLTRKLLVNSIIIPFRVGKSTRLYKRLWTANGSPLLYYLNNLASKLEKRLSAQFHVYKAMRYGQPSLSDALKQLKSKQYASIIIIPLFPQYASSTTGSIIEKVFNVMSKWEAIPSISIINQFYKHPDFLEVYAALIMQYNPEQYDHVIFSYHGLPYRQINKIHPCRDCQECTCEKKMPDDGSLCYKATCYETTRLLAKNTNIPDNKLITGFQSRLSKNWLSPFTDKIIIDLAEKGAKKILITAPSFVADCLETIVELEFEYQNLFKKHGGEKLTLVKSLNDSDNWVACLANMISKNHQASK